MEDGWHPCTSNQKVNIFSEKRVVTASRNSFLLKLMMWERGFKNCLFRDRKFFRGKGFFDEMWFFSLALDSFCSHCVLKVSFPDVNFL
jgi:hypothetical protein